MCMFLCVYATVGVRVHVIIRDPHLERERKKRYQFGCFDPIAISDGLIKINNP